MIVSGNVRHVCRDNVNPCKKMTYIKQGNIMISNIAAVTKGKLILMMYCWSYEEVELARCTAVSLVKAHYRLYE